MFPFKHNDKILPSWPPWRYRNKYIDFINSVCHDFLKCWGDINCSCTLYEKGFYFILLTLPRFYLHYSLLHLQSICRNNQVPTLTQKHSILHFRNIWIIHSDCFHFAFYIGHFKITVSFWKVVFRNTLRRCSFPQKYFF